MWLFQFLLCGLLAAHFYRQGRVDLAILSFSFYSLHFWRIKEKDRILQIFNIVAFVVWAETFFSIAQMRLEQGAPFVRLLVVGFAVLVFHFVMIWKKSQELKKDRRPELFAISAAFYLTFFALLLVYHISSRPMLLAPRFFGQYGAIQIFIHAVYSSALCHLFLTSKSTSRLRSYLWTFFTVFFFSQLLIGGLGIEQFLMSGKLHYPLPALILSTPLYQVGTFFMPLLLLSVILLVGPSWCSHLCYIGAFDHHMARIGRGNWKRKISSCWRYLRFVAFILALVLPVALRVVEPTRATLHFIIWSFIGCSLLLFYLSYKSGRMLHCTYFCPIGLVTNHLGKINPFRIRVSADCDLCMKCVKHCQYSALDREALHLKKVKSSCSLCLDCTEVCHTGALQLVFAGKQKLARPLFYALVLSLHSIFVALARL